MRATRYLIPIIYLLLGMPLISQTPTYFKDIKPILADNCTSCHRSDHIGAMPLTEYADVASYAEMIYYVTSTKLMPPFKADPQFSHLKNQRKLDDSEIQTIRNWIDQGLLMGEPEDDSKSSVRNEPSSSPHTLKVCMEEPFEQFDIYYSQYQVFCIPTHFKKNKKLQSIRFIPGNLSIVRSADISFSTVSDGNRWDEWDPRYGYFNFGGIRFEPDIPNVYSWFPTDTTLHFSADQTINIPAQSDLMLHVHYGPTNKVSRDSSCVEMVFKDENSSNIIQNVPLVNESMISDTFHIPAGVKKRYSVHVEILSDQTLYSVTPLSHLLCRSWEIYVVNADKHVEPILKIPDWDFSWKERYTLAQPLQIKAGSTIIATATFDNTSDNPYNPSEPPHAMHEGPHMFDEQFKCYFEIAHLTKLAKPIHFDMLSSIINKDDMSVRVNIPKRGNYEIDIFNLKNGRVVHKIEIAHTSSGPADYAWNTSQLSSGNYLAQIKQDNKILDSWYLIKP